LQMRSICNPCFFIGAYSVIYNVAAAKKETSAISQRLYVLASLFPEF